MDTTISSFFLLAAIPTELSAVLISHLPLRHDLVWLPRIPPFSLCCGTTQTENWHLQYRAVAVVFGHLHVSQTSWRDGVRFEKVSVGYAHEQPARTQAEIPPRQVLPAL